MLQRLKPPALRPGDTVRIVSVASPVDESRLLKGRVELERLGYAVAVDRHAVFAREGFFAGSKLDRVSGVENALRESASRAIFFARGGYGSNYLLEHLINIPSQPKILCGFSDITSLQLFFWKRFCWVTLYGPMVASGLDAGANTPGGYDPESLTRALSETSCPWSIDLSGESLVPGTTEGILLGGCLTLVEATLGTPWEVDSRDAILILEDRDMKPYQVDRALLHLKQAGKFQGAAGIILGEFPGCEAPPGTEAVRDVARRILAPLGVPVVWGAPIGHANRPMLTLPLGVPARLSANQATLLEVLEPAVT